MPATATVTRRVDPLDHQGLVGLIAKRHLGRGLEFDDLVAEGQIGLLIACERFEPARGLKFSTYAQHWIRHSIGRALRDQARPFRIPAYLQSAIGRGERPDSPELPARRRKCLAAAFEVFDRAPVRETSLEDASLAELAVDYRGRAVELPHDPSELLSQIPSRSARVLRMRFGFDPYSPMTLAAVGLELGVGRERVRQIESAALAQLRVVAKAQETSLT